VGAGRALIFLEPNLSAALLVVLLSALELFAGGARIGHFIVLGLIAVPVVWAKVQDAGYRMKRIVAFLDPTGDTQGAAYQIYQSLIAIGSGGVGGVGFGNSRQKFGFLPEAHNDFLFSMIAEEWGLLGVIFVVSVFAAFLVVGYRIAARAHDRFGYLVAIGMTNLIVVTASCTWASRWRCCRRPVSPSPSCRTGGARSSPTSPPWDPPVGRARRGRAQGAHVSAPRVLFAGGGTGGHLYPALALADAFQRMHPAPR
jgi:hypothetical protein